MIEVNDVTVRFGGVVALNAVQASFSQPVSGIIGPNGAGKTTLMNVLSGFVQVHSGSVICQGVNLLSMAPHKRAKWGLRRSFQKEEIANDLTVLENVLVQADHVPGNTADKLAQVHDLLAFVGMADKTDTPGRSLNSFERRLTDIAKCMAGQPRLVMFDEPAGGLSVDETQRLGDLILQVHDRTGAQVLVIDHDVELISRICSETLVLDFGKRIAFGPTRDVLADPKVKSAYLGTEEV
ncbi:ABC transporter ATP-binding protein [Pseudoprimorskyibacter insulae]|uniref:Lipopolysaccharide export system ATP-binding protein LptB n=1 Tax=Pseudoprimorskyibacter insulae TaxID=1695997 RepID=A0A2R8ATX5_9RHOB|nr:ATP-binding cassette domain-containing protein [Pseudoprimorskyibacter insulae]SPF79501.1 Lipopolysaccharide export system ATP-binding protein LptB [Pseudoprimorskyibacter insulae]